MYEYIIWLEIHVKLATKHKIFCMCENSQDFDNSTPNSHICPTCTAQPGALPIINPECIQTAIRLWHIFHSELNRNFARDRKSYFYPDSPAGFQITQFREPIIQWWALTFYSDNFQKEHTIAIHEAHLENDTAKTITIDGTTFIDFNRSGGPLIEVVTKPEFKRDDEVVEFLKELQRVVRLNSIWYGDLEKGQMRVDVNISVRKQGEEKLGTRVEVKNINSFASIRKAIEYEFERHQKILKDWGIIDQETRGRDDSTNQTYSLRSKENAHDYRYMPENDLPKIDPASIDRDQWEIYISWYKRISQLKSFGFQKEYIYGLMNNELFYSWFDKAIAKWIDPKMTAKWILGPIANVYNIGWEDNINISEEDFQTFLRKISQEKVPDTIAKQIMEELLKGRSIEDSFTAFASQWGDEVDLNQIITHVLISNPSIVEQYKWGKKTVIMFLLGQVMKATWGRLDPTTIKSELEKMLGS